VKNGNESGQTHTETSCDKPLVCLLPNFVLVIASVRGLRQKSQKENVNPSWALLSEPAEARVQQAAAGNSGT